MRLLDDSRDRGIGTNHNHRLGPGCHHSLQPLVHIQGIARECAQSERAGIVLLERKLDHPVEHSFAECVVPVDHCDLALIDAPKLFDRFARLIVIRGPTVDEVMLARLLQHLRTGEPTDHRNLSCSAMGT